MRALSSKYNHHRRAFSLLEVLVTVAVIGIVAAIAAVNYGGVRTSSSSAKLQSDVRSINTAVTTYLASGGNLDGITDPQAVLDKLKTARTDEEKTKFSGLGGTAIDKRLVVRLQTGDEVSSDAARAIWNPAQQRFEIGASGDAGIASFEFDEALAASDFGTESRDPSAIDRNDQDGWIWKDDVSATALASLDPRAIAVDRTPPATPVFDRLPGRLSPPVITPGERAFTVFDFPVTADFINPAVNDPTKSEVFFAIQSPASTDLVFQRANGPISITRDQTIVAFTKSISPDIRDSSSAAAVFTVQAFGLQPPEIEGDRQIVELDSGGNLTLNLVDVNPAGSLQQLEFSLSGQEFQEFSGPTQVSAAGLSDGLVVSARSRALNSDFADSSVSEPVRFLVKLAAPSINVQAGAGQSNAFTVNIDNPNPANSSTIFFKVLNRATGQETAFQRFVGPFNLADSQFPSGFEVTAVARSNNPIAFLDSDEASRNGLGFFGLPVQERTVLVLDTSGSMRTGTRIADVISETVRFLGVLPPENQFAVVQFQSSSTVLVSMRPATPANVSSAQAAVRGLQAGGGTNFAPALNSAGTQNTEQVILLSDGAPNDSLADVILPAVSRLASRTITVDTIGFESTGSANTALQQVASRGGGSFRSFRR